jgi:CHAT domain-containing protein
VKRLRPIARFIFMGVLTSLIVICWAFAVPGHAADEGIQLYSQGRFAEAAQVWEQESERLSHRADDAQHHLQFVTTQNHLAIVYQDLGEWQKATDAIAPLLPQLSSLPTLLQAQILNTQGNLQLNQGQPEAALDAWEQSAQRYRTLQDWTGIVLSQINQAQALQTLGFYQRARDTLEQLQQELEPLPDSLLKAQSWRSLGVVLRVMGDLDRSQSVLKQSLAIAQSLQSPIDISEAHFQLGNTARAQQDMAIALQHYQQAQTQAAARTRLEAALNQFSLKVQTSLEEQAGQPGQPGQPDDLAAKDALQQQIPRLEAELAAQPPSRWSIYAQINFAEAISHFRQPGELASLVANAIQQARQIHDPRAESYGLGQLGHIYEHTQQWAAALQLTQEALTLANRIQADDIAVNWQWQQGRIWKAQGLEVEAMEAYDQAIATLGSLRQDLLVMDSEVQYSFRDRVEPIYRQYVGLLLEDMDQLSQDEQQQRLQRSRTAIEALQLAELQNYFREACKTYDAQPIEQIDPQAAVIYPIVLADRLEVILSLPHQPLQHYGDVLDAQESAALINQMRQALNPAFPASTGLPAAQKLYDWLIRPAEPQLQQQNIQTLVFVLDDFWRSIPIAALHDGHHYLVEQYSLALTPGLQLLQSTPAPSGQILIGGISQATQGFSALPGVEREVTAIAQQAPSQVLLNQDFTPAHIQAQLAKNPYEIVHLATHGQFSSNAADTFILTWGDRLRAKDLTQWLQQTPIDLLILSACQTAKGDSRATLGLAGIAVQSGASSTIATLWNAQDQSTAELMSHLYQHLSHTQALSHDPETHLSKAAALRNAQVKLLNSTQYHHPYYWAAFVLVGNWK